MSKKLKKSKIETFKMLQSFDSDQSNLKSILDIENREAQK